MFSKTVGFAINVENKPSFSVPTNTWLSTTVAAVKLTVKPGIEVICAICTNKLFNTYILFLVVTITSVPFVFNFNPFCSLIKNFLK